MDAGRLPKVLVYGRSFEEEFFLASTESLNVPIDNTHILLVVLHVVAFVATALVLLLWPTSDESAKSKRFHFSLWQIFIAIFCFAAAFYLFRLPRLEHRWEMDIRPLMPSFVADILIGAGIGVICGRPVVGAILFPVLYMGIGLLAAVVGVF
jgi:hypothetical protein